VDTENTSAEMRTAISSRNQSSDGIVGSTESVIPRLQRFPLQTEGKVNRDLDSILKSNGFGSVEEAVGSDV